MKNINDDYLTDEALEELIASVESEPLLHPPKGFGDEIIYHILQKRKYKKNLQLFSYSMKVIAATAASLAIVLVVPDNMNKEEGPMTGIISQLQDEIQDGKLNDHRRFGQETKKSYDERFTYKLNKHMDEYVSIVNGKLNELVRMEVNINEKEKE
ncbi:MAG: hypothetical protein J1E98_06575 [Lachnospiraceae bacterium]|nr:hypothetical protein [Lachnospiraceae bacterium]